ncbi:MAG: hypothetical protein M0006_01020 [Magnetospirillum sp.]|nr:hypothetical protein [Magnetospirillum sp.]
MARLRVVAGALVAGLLVAAAAPAADIASMIDTAKQAYQKGDLALANRTLQAALAGIQDRLGRGFSQFMPASPAGWEAEDAEIQGLGAVGGGLSVTRAYTKGDSSLNASIILDSPAVEAASALFDTPAGQPNLTRIKVGNEDALLRWDPESKSGDITIVLDKRVLLQIEGDSLPDSDSLVDLAKGFNLAGIRKLANLPS